MKEVMYRIFRAVLVAVPVLTAVAVAIPVLVCDQFRIGGRSMDPVLIAGDHIFVNKLLFGARIYTDYDFSKPDVRSFRMPGLRRIRPGDIIVFNSTDARGDDTVSFRINYVYAKRCIGTPGDTVWIENGYYRNSSVSGIVGTPAHQKELSVTPDSVLREQGVVLDAGKFAGWPGWTLKEFGPLYLPRKGDVITLDSLTAKIYGKLIQYETGNWPEAVNGKVTLGGRPIKEYAFRSGYYFMGGDNVADSKDSRYIGPVPEEYIVGIVTHVIFSEDYDGSLRKDRIWKRI